MIMPESKSHRKPNKLIRESSPYLLQHAYNPVDWHAWNDKTLQKAREENKPLLVSIGYSTCHWCHVMERESFEDEEVALLMNGNFICIKVDREERPDVDQWFMDAVQMIGGAGGWPLNCFALPDGRPFYGGTYFRKEQWKDILQRVAGLNATNSSELEDYAKQVIEGIRKSGKQHLSANEKIRIEDVEMFRDKLHASADFENGGLKGAPKFPLPAVLESELNLSALYEDKLLFNHLELTLEKIASGGVYDQVGGGFARYAVDKSWKVPHFEKMLYDNAQLLSVYSKAYKTSPRQLYRDAAEETIGFLQREFKSGEGAYFSALDADSEGEEGRFYVWEEKEFDDVLGPYADLMKKYFGVGKDGYWEGHKNILVRAENKHEFAQRENLSEAELDALIRFTKKKLLKARDERARPSLDDKIITSWNALAVIGLLDAYTAFEDETFLALSLQNLDFLIENRLKEDGHCLRISGETVIDGFLEDYALAGQALLKAFSVTGKAHYLDMAGKIAAKAIDLFYDKQSGLFFFTSKETELPNRQTDYHDNVIPSSNSLMMTLLHSLGMITENHQFIDMAKKALASIIPGMYQSVVAYANWSNLLQTLQYGTYVMAVTGPEAKARAKELLSYYLPHVQVAFSDHPSEVPVLKNRYSEEKTRIFICTDSSCLEPVESVNEAIRKVKRPEK